MEINTKCAQSKTDEQLTLPMKWDIDLWQNIQLEQKGQQSNQQRKRNNKQRETKPTGTHGHLQKIRATQDRPPTKMMRLKKKSQHDTRQAEETK